MLVLQRGEIASDGIAPATSTSLIVLSSPVIALLDDSRVTSLTGDGAPIRGSGEARLLGDLTFISEDSEVLGSSTVELAGVDNTVGADLQLSPGVFLDAGGLLVHSQRSSCASR